MSDFCVCGVDPGSHGAVAFLAPEAGWLAVYNLPVYKVEGSTRTHTFADPAGLADLLDQYNPVHTYLEKVGYIKGDGGMGSFSFGDNYGTIKGVHGGARRPLTLVTPQVWKKNLRVTANKAEAVARAKQLFPACSALFTRPDRAEAALIGLYGVLDLGHVVKVRFTTKT